jgi:hypothetical protein
LRPRLQIAFCTGQSDPNGCALSSAQAAFLEALPAPGAVKLGVNFPYRRDTPPHREIGLLRASWNNARQYAASRRPRFARAHRASVMAMLQGADRHVLLAGSCGLELLANLALPPEALRRMQVFAYGPVARRAPECEVYLVQGRRDWLSRACFHHPDAHVDCGHLGYLVCREARDLCAAFVARVAADHRIA